jgi:hypothetical protein
MKKGRGRIRIGTGVKSVFSHAAADLLSHALLSAELLPALRAPPDLRPFLPNRFRGRLNS